MIEEATTVIEVATTTVGLTVGDSTTMVVTEVVTGAGQGLNDQRDISELEQTLLCQLLASRLQTLLPAQKVCKGRRVERQQVFSSAQNQMLL